MSVYEKLINYGILKKHITEYDDKSYLVKDDDNHGTGLNLIINDGNINNYAYNAVFKNPCYDCDHISSMYGKFWIDSEGTRLFYPLSEEEASHVILKGYCKGYNNSKGVYLKDTIGENFIYYKCIIDDYNKVNSIYFVLEKRIYDLLL